MGDRAQFASDALGRMLDLVYEWEAKADAFVATGDDDADVVVTHDSRGRLLELTIRPGLQQELTVDELEEAVNDEIGENALRAREGLEALSEEFLANFAHLPEELAQHPVAVEFAEALRAAGST
ncbi:hypothetical protein [Mycolicibacterium arenosum]|uniref:DNA-binding protein n=1 Tax=Mycolicibacterium arenosum TaxID=2952157 RepID=A0ABT1MC91_9MYCO|nr:hypothetical protein [Mycolicibacterium sp. CAU 1645]MCP9276485.1 hypothetical protein [Mycolicibacterium sp. CAU 1645]